MGGPSQAINTVSLELHSKLEEASYSVSHVWWCGKDNGRDGSRGNQRATGPKAIHFKEHPPEVWACQIPIPQCETIGLTTTAVDSNDVLYQNIQGRRHRRALGRR